MNGSSKGCKRFADKEFVGVDAAELNLEEDAVELEGIDDQKAEAIELISFLKQKLAGRVEDVVESKRLTDSPCLLVASQSGLSRNMERLMKMTDREFKGSLRTLEINRQHPDHPQHGRGAQARPRLRAIGELGAFSG